MMAEFCLHLFVFGVLFNEASGHSCEPQMMMLCPSGWESWNGSCYKLLEEQMTWHGGRLKCQEIGGEMVAPSSSEENNYVLSKTNFRVWINCNDSATEGQWDCTPDNGGYRNWYTKWGEPGGGARENCAMIQFDKDGGWLDVQCTQVYSSICKGEEVVATQAKLKQWRLLASCLTGHTLREIPTSNVRACATVCDYDPRCRSFNLRHFGREERTCQLNNATRYEADHAQFVESKKPVTCIYGEK